MLLLFAMIFRCVLTFLDGVPPIPSNADPTICNGKMKLLYFFLPKVAVPDKGRSKPRSILSVELFPAPLGPRKAVMRPSLALKVIFSSIFFFLCCLHIFERTIFLNSMAPLNFFI